ncbi:MAG TPA: hypothetical protein VKD71_01530 [Gemmataceae bacterium]|nr:hypothetical protein [Gemmataceae bacterium]
MESRLQAVFTPGLTPGVRQSWLSETPPRIDGWRTPGVSPGVKTA